MAGDLHYQNVGLLLPGNGANGSTTFTDKSSTPKIVTAYGNVQISTAQSVFGGSSILFDGLGDYLTVASHADFAFGTSDFTVEFFFRQATAGTNFLLDFRPNSSTNGAYITTYIDRGTVQFYSNTGVRITSGAITVGAWYHFELSRSAGSTKMFLNGAQAGSSYADSTNYLISPVNIGASGNGTSTFNGNMSPIRTTKGVARHTSAFTPPALPYPDYAGQIHGNVKDAAGANAARLLRAYRRDTGALSGSATSDASTGNYTINCPTVGEHTVIALDDDAGNAYNALVLDRITPV